MRRVYQNNFVATTNQDAQDVGEVAIARYENHNMWWWIVTNELEDLDQNGHVGSTGLA
jgi:hypothetical protein